MGDAKRRKDAGEMRPFDMKGAVRNFQAAVKAARGARLTTPQHPLSSRVKSFCASISPQDPVFLPITDVGYDYKTGQCHTNVRHYVRENSGEVVGGWLVWENPGWVELIGHSVWRSAGGDLVDVTPTQDGEGIILFLPDATVVVTILSDHQVIPSSRSSILGCPYLLRGQPIATPTITAYFDEATRQEMARLGMLPVD